MQRNGSLGVFLHFGEANGVFVIRSECIRRGNYAVCCFSTGLIRKGSEGEADRMAALREWMEQLETNEKYE